jgi:hypothetical protein
MTQTLRPRRERSKHELRCFCRGEPLLAVYGITEAAELYVHIKVYKQGRVYGESIHFDGRVVIRCRNCLRWNRVAIIQRTAKLEVTDPPVVAEGT